MGGSPCKAWDWRNPIVQTLFTQGATRTAVLRARRDSRTNGRGCPSASARGGAVVPPGPGGRGPGLFRLWTAIYQRPASDPVGREGGGGSCQGRAKAPTSRGGGRQNRPGRAEAPASRGGAAGGRSPPGGGLRPRPCSALWAERRPPPPKGAAKPPRPGKSANVPRGGGGRAEPARRGPLAPAMFGPSGRTPPPPPPGTLAYRALSLAPSLVSSTP